MLLRKHPPAARLRYAAATGLVLLAFSVRLYHLGAASLWYDELLELDIALETPGQIWSRLAHHSAMPLDYYLLNGWLKLGRQEAWVRFPALVFGTLAVPLTWMLACRLFNRRAGYLAGVLLAVSPFAVRYSQEARPYALLLVWVVAAYWGLWQAYRTGRRRYWGWVMAGLAGGLLTHYFALFVVAPMGLFVAGWQVYSLRQKRHPGPALYFALCLVALVLVLAAAGRFWRVYSVGVGFSQTLGRPALLALPPAEKPNRGPGPPQTPTFFVENILMPLSTTNRPGLLLFNLFLVAALVSLAARRPQHTAAGWLLLGWLVVPPLLTNLFLLQRGTFFADRYILYSLPPYLMLTAAGIDRLAGRIGRGLPGNRPHYRTLALLALAALVAVQAVELAALYAAGSKEDWRAVGELLRANAAPADAVIAVRAEPAINWYYPPARAGYGVYSRNVRVWNTIRQHNRHWFVLSSYSARYDRQLRAWLQNRGAVPIAIDRRVVVYFHQEGASPGDMLARVQTFALPNKALTYAVLGNRLAASGDIRAGRLFYQKAVDLATDPAQKITYQARLMALAGR